MLKIVKLFKLPTLTTRNKAGMVVVAPVQNYDSEQIIAALAKHLEKSEEDTERLIVTIDEVGIEHFILHDVIVGRSFNDICPFKLFGENRHVNQGKYSKAGMVVAYCPKDESVREKVRINPKKVSPYYRSLIAKATASPLGV